MPNSPSAIKRMKSSEKRRQQNQAALTEIHSRFRKLVSLASDPSKIDDAKQEARTLVSRLDKAVVQGIIPHGRADRKKSRIGKLLNKK